VRRAVLDPGVLVSALIAPNGRPAEILEQAQAGQFELIASPHLLAELEEVLRRDKFRRYVELKTVERFLQRIRDEATVVDDPSEPAPLKCGDSNDDYLLALAYAQKAVLVSGDSDLLDLTGGAPICAPADFLRP
jgi:putative PIN family toxin of toxin-antitoxin system